MSENWLDKLEKGLEERLSEFIRSNPDQEVLLKEQYQKDRFQLLTRQQLELKAQAKEQKRQLIALATTIKEWRIRSQRAKEAEAIILYQRAEQHLINLMEEGRKLWADLESLRKRFRKIETEIVGLSKKSNTEFSSLEEDWAKFEAQQELNQLKQNCGLDN